MKQQARDDPSQGCRLDVLRPDDLPALAKLFTCPAAREFLGGPLDSELAMQRSRDWIDISPTAPIWAIRKNPDNIFLGYVLLGDHHDGDDTEISYALLPEYWNRGYATDALAEALTRARQDLGLEKLVAETQANNHRSIKLLERIGMVEGHRLTRFGEEQIFYRINLTNSRLPDDLLAMIGGDYPDPSARESVSTSLDKLWDGGINVGPAQLARAIVFLANGDIEVFRELRKTFFGDPRDLLCEANSSQQNPNYWFSEPFSEMGPRKTSRPRQ